MTREEASENLEKLAVLYEEAAEQSRTVDYSVIIETLRFASSNLRPITREQVKMMRGEWIHDGPEFEGGTDWYHCSTCGIKETGVYVQSNFCSICGQPKTDEAVEIMMKRLGEMRNGQ